MQKSNLFGTVDKTTLVRREVLNLDDLTLGEDKLKLSRGRYYDHSFNRVFGGFTKERLKKYTDRKELLEHVSRVTGNEAHTVSAVNGGMFKVHFFGEVIEVKEYRYVVRAGLLFDPTLMSEGKTEGVLVNEYLKLIAELNNHTKLEFHRLDKGEWVLVSI